MNGRKPAARAKKEAFFVQVPTSDNSVAYFNVTEHLGKAMPFEKPKATCAMRVTAETISFSLLHLTKRAATNIAGEPLQMPRGPLAKLERRATTFADLGEDEIAVEHGRDEEGKALVQKLKIERDDNGIAHISSEEEVDFELPKGAVGLSIYMRSPAVKRVMGVGFIGHLGKPGDPTSLTRAVSMALFSLSQLTEFKILSGIETVNVPAPPSKWGAGRKPTRRAEERAAVMIPTRFFSGDPQPMPVGAGQVGVEVDLENANPNSGRLLFHYTPDKSLEEAFPAFRALYDTTVSALVTSHLGADEVADITYEIVLGAVESGTIERLKEALEVIKGLDCTPTQYRLHA